MKILDQSQHPYTPSFMQPPGYLARRFDEIRKQQLEAERRRLEELAQRFQRPEEWR